MDIPASFLPEGQITGKRRIERVPRAEQVVVNSAGRTHLPDLLVETIDSIEVRTTQRSRLGVQFEVYLQTLEQSVLLKRKTKFILVHHVQDNYFVLSQAKLLDALGHGRRSALLALYSA